MRIMVSIDGAAIHPNEAVVSLATTTGAEKLVVHRKSLRDNTIDVGYPIFQEDDRYLIELPRETMSGQWRVWVDEGQLIFDEDREVA